MQNNPFKLIAFTAAATAGAYYAVWKTSGDLKIAQSAAFITLVLAQMVHIFECRGKTFSLKGNPVLLFAATASIAITLFSTYVPAAQQLFGTVSVSGVDLLPVAVGILVGPLGSAMLRRLKRIFV
jgi:Ca2+-transporting ATPase